MVDPRTSPLSVATLGLAMAFVPGGQAALRRLLAQEEERHRVRVMAAAEWAAYSRSHCPSCGEGLRPRDWYRFVPCRRCVASP